MTYYFRFICIYGFLRPGVDPRLLNCPNSLLAHNPKGSKRDKKGQILPNVPFFSHCRSYKTFIFSIFCQSCWKIVLLRSYSGLTLVLLVPYSGPAFVWFLWELGGRCVGVWQPISSISASRALEPLSKCMGCLVQVLSH